MKGPSLIFILFILWSIFRSVMSKGKKSKNEARRTNLKRESSSQLSPEFAAPQQPKPAQRKPAQKKQSPKRNLELLDNDESEFDKTQVYSEIDPNEEQVSRFVLNRGMTTRDRTSVADEAERVRIDTKSALKLSFKPDELRRFVMMKEVLGAPRAMRPFRARQTYYVPTDLSRD
jgi:hypothetical protein